MTASSRLRRNLWRSRSPSVEQHDRVGDELAGAVIGDVAAALDLDDLDVAGREHVLLRLAAAAEREHVRMLDDDQRVGRLADLARLDERELALPTPRGSRRCRDRGRCQGRSSAYSAAYRQRLMTWMASPSAAAAASIIASDSVGCGWIVRRRSSTTAPISIASAPSVIRSRGAVADDVHAEQLAGLARRRRP